MIDSESLLKQKTELLCKGLYLDKNILKFNKIPFNIPVLYITQLLGITMGLDLVRQGLIKNHDLKGVSPFTSLQSFLNVVKEQLI